MKKHLVSALCIAGLMLTVKSASAALVTYTGLDVSQATPIGPNSAAAQASFLSAIGPVTTIDFETALPSGVGVSGGSIISGSSCGFALCGDNTTPGGSMYLSLYGGTATFSFSTPISAFGAYFSGTQLTESITFSDGSSQEVFIPNGGLSSGGMSFASWIDSGKFITSVTINTGTGADYCTNCDIIGVDDVLISAVPEPEIYAMLLAGLGLLGFMARRRKESAV